MSTSTTSLVYALPIRASDLIAAARVYSKVGPASLGLSLAVRSLKQHNVLPSWLGPAVPAINRVPVEVWEMIRQELIDLEVVAVRGEVVALFDCPICTAIRIDDALQEDFGELDESKTLKQLKQEEREAILLNRKELHEEIAFNGDWVDGVYTLHNDVDCDFEPDINRKWKEFTDEEVKKKAIDSVLGSFGLSLPSKEVLHSKQLKADRSDSVVLIAADLTKHEHASAMPAKVVNEIDRHGINNSSVAMTNLSNDFFETHNKLNLNNRFNRFLSTYSVTAHHLPKPLKPVSPGAAAGAGAGAPPAAAAGAANAITAGGAAGGAAVANDQSSDDGPDEEVKPSAGWMILNELTRK